MKKIITTFAFIVCFVSSAFAQQLTWKEIRRKNREGTQIVVNAGRSSYFDDKYRSDNGMKFGLGVENFHYNFVEGRDISWLGVRVSLDYSKCKLEGVTNKQEGGTLSQYLLKEMFLVDMNRLVYGPNFPNKLEVNLGGGICAGPEDMKNGPQQDAILVMGSEFEVSFRYWLSKHLGIAFVGSYQTLWSIPSKTEVPVLLPYGTRHNISADLQLTYRIHPRHNIPFTRVRDKRE